MGDFDGDGTLDIISVVAGGTQFQQLFGDGNGSFSPPVLTRNLLSTTLVGTEDFNNDGRDDILATRWKALGFPVVKMGYRAYRKSSTTPSRRIRIDSEPSPILIMTGV